MNGEIRLTRVKKQGGALLCKRIAADDHGHPVSDDGGPCAMARGTATRVRLNGSPAANLAFEILDLGSHEALVVGDLADGLPDRIKLESPRKAQHQNAVRAHGHQKCPVHPVRPVLASSGAASGRTGRSFAILSILSEAPPWTDLDTWRTHIGNLTTVENRRAVLREQVTAAGGWSDAAAIYLPTTLPRGLALGDMKTHAHCLGLDVHEDPDDPEHMRWLRRLAS